ncbi:hypothetical protein DPV78_008763 [Talaromyces pinophilus]|nr:hypothetical protein DPV78_008763 [Talaromyces pinophilus]
MSKDETLFRIVNPHSLTTTMEESQEHPLGTLKRVSAKDRTSPKQFVPPIIQTPVRMRRKPVRMFSEECLASKKRGRGRRRPDDDAGTAPPHQEASQPSYWTE